MALSFAASGPTGGWRGRTEAEGLGVGGGEAAQDPSTARVNTATTAANQKEEAEDCTRIVSSSSSAFACFCIIRHGQKVAIK